LGKSDLGSVGVLSNTTVWALTGRDAKNLFFVIHVKAGFDVVAALFRAAFIFRWFTHRPINQAHFSRGAIYGGQARRKLGLRMVQTNSGDNFMQ